MGQGPLALTVPLRRHDTFLFNPARVDAARAEWFVPEYWLAQGTARRTAGGRGNVVFIDVGSQQWVLRHYRRGGLIGKWVHDQYLWQGADQTRAFAELRLLDALHAQGLPVPEPIAAHYQRQQLWYRADLLTAAIPDSQTLAQRLLHGALTMVLWQDIGRTIARFHAAGVHHADLNAHNILIDARSRIWWLDFDRGRLRPVRRAWIDAVLARLLRSLTKLRERHGLHFTPLDWQTLCHAHDAALSQASDRAC